jgi:hypothetical protein
MRNRRNAAILFMMALLLVFALGANVFAGHGGGGLVDVGPVSPDYGFPMWYQDANGLILEPCLDPALCFFFPPDPAAPIEFPDNFADEIFYWAAEALMIDATPPAADDPGGKLGRAVLTLGLEGAFLGPEIVPGEQVVFGRIRIRVDNLQVGETYVVTHPYGQDTFVVGEDAGPGVIAGPGISFVEDIGIGQLGDFTGAFESRIGPFLLWDPATAPAPPPGYIADGGLTLQKVIGSPYNTNFFRVEGPNVGDPSSPYLCADPTLGPDPVAVTDCIETDLFAVQGKLATRFGVGIEQATYSQNAAGAGSVNVFARSVSGLAQTIELGVANFASSLFAGDANGRYFAQQNYFGTPPTVVTATNTSDVPWTAVSGIPVDVVTITRAEYDVDNGTLTIDAASSDQFGVPVLTAVGYGDLVSGTLTVSGVTVPPVEVVVISSAGGQDRELVRVTAVNNNVAPMADDDLAVTPEETAVTIPVILNDTDVDGVVLPATIMITYLPKDGTVTVPGDGTVIYTPAQDFFGEDKFRYSVLDDLGAESNRALVTVTVTNVNDAPVAVDDTAVTPTYDVLANDYDVDSAINPASVALVTLPANGTATANLDGTITYTPTLGFVGNDTLTYTVQDVEGAVSNAAAATFVVTDGSPVVQITSPIDGGTIVQGTAVALTGEANDNQDGSLTHAINWSSSIDGALGTGSPLPNVYLSAGTHTITASVTDSDGNNTSAAITLNVLGGTSPIAHGVVHPTYGFPVWYQDSLGTTLELCLDAADPLCNFHPGDIPNPELPVSFPDNFPVEPFYWLADSVILNGAQRATLTMSLSGTFANAAVVDGEQVSHIIIETKVDTLVPGETYTVTHPYGVDVGVADANGDLRILTTVGGDVIGDFTTVYNGLSGPFLTWSPLSDAPAGYVGSPLAEHVVTGSPYGTNFFRIEGVDAGGPGVNVLESDLFSLMGKLATAATGPANTAPTLVINTPTSGQLIDEGAGPSFTASVTDAEEPALGNTVVWSSDVDGQFGTGAVVSSTALTPGPHIITAYVVDSGGLEAVASVPITVNGRPVVNITSPTDGSSYTAGTSVLLEATASDLEDGDLTAAIAWSSDLDGALGTGGSLPVSTLSVGTHLLTAAVVDSNGLAGEASVTIIVNNAPSNVAPTVTITAPASGSTFEEGTAVTFTATASDTEDGDLTAAIAWSSDLDGALGTGGTLNLSTLTVGTHTITASATDSGGLTGTDTITVEITAPVVDIVTVSRADYRTRRLEWRIIGSGNMPGSVITIYIGPSVGGQVLATNIVVDALGNWEFREAGSAVFPDGSMQISIQSSNGGVYEGFPLRVR